MKSPMTVATTIAAAAVITVGVASATQATPAPATQTQTTIACGICSGPIFQNGQICFLYSCDNGPCDILRCLKF